jgi:hypothetical protein
MEILMCRSVACHANIMVGLIRDELYIYMYGLRMEPDAHGPPSQLQEALRE